MSRRKRFTFLPSLREGILKKNIFYIIPVRGHGSFPGLIFHIQDVENEPPVLKEIPPLNGKGQPVGSAIKSLIKPRAPLTQTWDPAPINNRVYASYTSSWVSIA